MNTPERLALRQMQNNLGAKLMPAALRALGDDELRRYRHEYPEETAIMNTPASTDCYRTDRNPRHAGHHSGRANPHPTDA